MVWPAVIGGGIAAAGSIGSTALANKRNKDLADTAVQRRVADLKKAGLNPVLAAQNGSLQAAQTPQTQTPDIAGAVNTGVGIYNATTAKQQANTAKSAQSAQAQQIQSNIQLQKAQTASQIANAAKTAADTRNAMKAGVLIDQQALTQQAVQSNYAAQTGLTTAQKARVQYQTTQDKVISDYLGTPVGQMAAHDAYNKNGGKFFGSLNSISDRVSHAWDSITGNLPHSAKAVSKKAKTKPMITIRGANGSTY